LTADDLYDKDKVDLETIDVEDVYKLLQSQTEGLADEEAQRRIELFGPNKLEEKHVNPFLQVGHFPLSVFQDLTVSQFLSFMWNPLSWVMEAAALVAIVLSNGQGSAPDWEDFCGIIFLLFVNSSIGFYEEHNAGNAVKALMESLAPRAKVKRDDKWGEIEASNLVPGDMISFKIGDIVPADCRLTTATNVSIDQAALTGESLPQNKKSGDECFS
jgi:H+-transporting ATPase